MTHTQGQQFRKRVQSYQHLAGWLWGSMKRCWIPSQDDKMYLKYSRIFFSTRNLKKICETTWPFWGLRLIFSGHVGFSVKGSSFFLWPLFDSLVDLSQSTPAVVLRPESWSATCWHAARPWWRETNVPTVDGNQKSGKRHQRLVAEGPMIYKVSKTSQVKGEGFLPSTVLWPY